jgi:dUTPase
MSIFKNDTCGDLGLHNEMDKCKTNNGTLLKTNSNNDVAKVLSSEKNRVGDCSQGNFQSHASHLQMMSNGSGSQPVTDQDRMTCPQCNKTFSTKQSLSTHIKTAKSCVEKNKKKKVFQCTYCSKILSSKQMLLYHDGICNMKTQHEYEQKLLHLQSLITNGNTNDQTTNSQQPQQFYEMNILMKCELVSKDARIPRKKNGLAFDLFSTCAEPIEIPSFSKVVVPLGLKIRLLNGWYGTIIMAKEHVESGLAIANTMIDPSHWNDELELVVCNMNDKPYTIDLVSHVAELRFCKSMENVNIHLNYVNTC